MPKLLLGTAAFCAAWVLGANPTHAQSWNNPNGGSIADPANWSPHGTPTSASAIAFGLPDTYTVTVPTDFSVNTLRVFRGNATFDGMGHTLSTLSNAGPNAPGLFVFSADVGGMTTATLLDGTFTAGSGTVGNGGSTDSQLNIGAGAIVQVADDFAIEQDSGTGRLMVSGGGSLAIANGGMNVGGGSPAAVGHLTVTGAGSQLSTPRIYVALAHSGSVLIDAGAHMNTTGASVIGEVGIGNAAIRGAGSTWRQLNLFSDSEFSVGPDSGSLGEGTFAVLDGGTLVSDTPVTVRTQGILCGNSSIQAAVLNGGSVAPGGAWDEANRSVVSTGQIGTLTISGDFTQTAQASLSIELLSATSSDSLSVGGVAHLNGSLDVSLLNGFQPQVGQTFSFLSAAFLFRGLRGARSANVTERRSVDTQLHCEWSQSVRRALDF